LLITRARDAARYVARVPQFFEDVMLKNYGSPAGLVEARRRMSVPEAA
jgi:hypothetical protein